MKSIQKVCAPLKMQKGLVVQEGPWAPPKIDRNTKKYTNEITNPQLELPVAPIFTVPVINGKDRIPAFYSDNHNTTSTDVTYLPDDLQETNVADWVDPIHRQPFLLCSSIYSTPLTSLNGWFLIPELTSTRIAVWKRFIQGTPHTPTATAEYFIGCRGTTPFGKDFDLDIVDDLLIGGIQAPWSGEQELSLVTEARGVMNRLVPAFDSEQEQLDPDTIMFGGHSLGGYSAIKLAIEYKVRGCSFNGGGAVLKTTDFGPGDNLISHYHIVGDFISTHVSTLTCRVLRVNKGYTGFSAGWPHALQRFLKSDPTIGFMTADEEDTLYLFWAFFLFDGIPYDKKGGVGTEVVLEALFPKTALALFESTKLLVQSMIVQNPIPGASRAPGALPQAFLTHVYDFGLAAIKSAVEKGVNDFVNGLKETAREATFGLSDYVIADAKATATLYAEKKISRSAAIAKPACNIM
jgi:pimeloyl-ACP methyl ester carboxylesterase